MQNYLANFSLFFFLQHLYRYESVIMYKLIKHKISRFLLHRRLQHMKCTLQEESSRNTQELSMLSEYSLNKIQVILI